MLYGVKFNSVDTLTQWGLAMLADLEVEAPEKKTNYIEIPGADGALDLSDYPQGRPTFKNRKISFNLFKRMEPDAADQMRTLLRQRYHGRRVKLILPTDAEHYFIGTAAIGKASGYPACMIPVTMTADPYKLKLQPTVVTETVSGTATVTLENEYMPVCPTIDTTGDVTLVFGSSSVSLSAGEGQRIPSLILESGETEITVTGSATVTFTYQEGTL